MKKQVRLTEADIRNMVSDAVYSILESARNKSNVEECGTVEEENDDFNDQPINNVAENRKQVKVTESELLGMIKESVINTLNEIGDKHRFGKGKYGLAMDAASKAKSLGRKDQAYNFIRHASDAFNKEYGTDNFQMDEFGNLRYNGGREEMMYRPKSRMDAFDKTNNRNAYDKADVNNAKINREASIAKAFPRKKMQGGLDAIDAVDAGIHGYTLNRPRR